MRCEGFVECIHTACALKIGRNSVLEPRIVPTTKAVRTDLVDGPRHKFGSCVYDIDTVPHTGRLRL